MKDKRILKVVLGLLLIILGVSLVVLAYYMIVDIETKVPKEVETSCNLKIEQFMGRKIFIVTPKDGPKNDLKILYFHGGAYVAEATKQHWDFIERLVKDTQCTVIFPDYPLTPKYNYKDVFGMVVPLYREILDKVEEKNLILMGDSAGGGLSLALAERMAQENAKLPNQIILISPWLDVRLTNPKIDEVQKKDPQLNKETLKLAGIAYASDDGIDSYLVNPIEGDVDSLKNITIFTGTYDILNPDVHVLQEKAKEVGVNVTIKEYEKAYHIWLIDRNNSKELVERAYQDLLQIITDFKKT